MTLLSTAYFPNIEYFKRIIEADEILIDIYEHFPKQTYRNRCEILAANGVQSLTENVEKGRTGKIITKLIKISYTENWVKNHIIAITSAYKSAPFFEYYWYEFEQILNKNEKYLIDLNQKILQQCIDFLEIDKKINYTSDFIPLENNFEDYRFKITPKIRNFKNNRYIQVFSDRFEFIPNMSILDLLFNLGPEAYTYIKNIKS